MQVTIYHNARCGKSRATLALLRERGIEPSVIDYLKNPPDAAGLARLLHLLGLAPRALMRSNEPDYRALGLDAAGLGDAALIAAMVAHPILIQRPIVVAGARAVVARPPEKVLEIL